MAKKAKRREVKPMSLRLRAINKAIQLATFPGWHYPEIEQAYMDGYRAARADARRESKRKEKV